MNTSPNVFKVYDIRGIYQKEFFDDFAYQLGLAYVKLRKQDPDATADGKIEVVVGCDMRVSSPALKKSLIEGLLDAGADVVDIDLCSTPTFYFAVADLKTDGGIMVSASHNPAEWNGFKMVRHRAIPISGDSGIEFLKQEILGGNLEKAEKRGALSQRDDALEKQIAHDLKWVDLNKIKPLKVVVDPANGMGAQYIEALFKHLPCELVTINFELDGRFPNHEADPLKEENLEDLKKKVIEGKADLGIAIDGDGDRVFFVDNEGKSINQAIIRGILAKLFLQEKPGSKIAYDVRPGRITYDLIVASGGQPVVSRVGHSLIKEQALREGIYFAGESSGHFFLNMDLGCFEIPNIVILKLLEEFSASDKSVADYVRPYDCYFSSGEINSSVTDKIQVLEKIEEAYKNGKINKLDGLSIEFEDFWFNVRGSNTEEKLRLNLEARSPELMEEKKNEILKIIRS